MVKALKSSLVALCGLATSIITAFALVQIEAAMHQPLFTYMVSIYYVPVVPAGAICSGFVAASGYVLASWCLNDRPTPPLLLQMAVIAGLTYVLVFWLEYADEFYAPGCEQTLQQYLLSYFRCSVTNTAYGLKDLPFVSTPLGPFGYVVVAIQFAGFMMGGLVGYIVLAELPYCEKCRRYYSKLAKTEKTFADGEALAQYHTAMFAHAMGSAEFASALAADHRAKTEKGALRLTSTLYGCPQCRQQEILSKVEVYNGQDWKEVPSAIAPRLVADGVDLQPAYKASQ